MSFEVGSIVFYDKGLTKGLLKGEEVGLAIVSNINPQGVFTIKYLNGSSQVRTSDVDTNINTDVIRFAVTDHNSHQVIDNVEEKDDNWFIGALLKLKDKKFNDIIGGNRNSKRRKSRRHKKTNRRRKSKRYKTNRYHRKY